MRPLPWPRPRAAALLSLCCAAGCGADDPEPKGEGDTGPAPITLEAWDAPAELIGVANIDDDDENGEMDWDDGAALAVDNERVELPLPAELVAALAAGYGLSLSLSGEVEAIRVYADGQLLLDEGTPAADLPTPTAAAVRLEVEFAGFLNVGALDFRVTDVDGVEVDAGSVALLSAPLILNHHLQPGEAVMAVDVGSGVWGNAALINTFEDSFGEAFSTAAGRSVGYDVWIQDEIEFATLTAPGKRLDVVINSIRSQDGRYLDRYPTEQLRAPDVAVMTWGDGWPSSQDSFGNMEVTPPLSADGTDYPFGRIYYGDAGYAQVNADLRAMLDAQRVQAPIVLDVSWLCVGHVDEFMTFLPDPDAPRGFRLIFADTRLGFAFLEGQPAALDLPKYASGHDYPTPGDMLADARLRAFNDDLQVNLDANLALLTAELDLAPEEVILIPALFESSPDCGGGALSLITGTVNMEVYTDPDGQGAVVLPPDPFFRSDTRDLPSDAFAAEIEALLPASVEVVWTDDWSAYHMAWGEVHCGSNTIRTPTADWWTDARALIGGEL
jgi:protein-arginine deiminase